MSKLKQLKQKAAKEGVTCSLWNEGKSLIYDAGGENGENKEVGYIKLNDSMTYTLYFFGETTQHATLEEVFETILLVL